MVHARALAAVSGAVVTVSAIVARHGHLLNPDGTTAAARQAPVSRTFTDSGVSAARRLVTEVAREAGLTDRVREDFVLAVQELMTNAVRHGGGWGRMSLTRTWDLLVCSVTDHGPGFDGDVRDFDGLPPLASVGGRGLWLAGKMTDTLHIRTSPTGVRVTVPVKRASPPPA